MLIELIITGKGIVSLRLFMHEIEPFYNWRHIYTSEDDPQSPFYGREYSEFQYSQTVYNYYVHPQWDEFGSRTLYLKVLMADYEEGYGIVELIGEWNDAVENDIMTLKRDVLEKMMDEGVYKLILIGENVLNFHNDTNDYYEELYEELTEENGWIVLINLPASSQHDFKDAKLHRYIELMQIENWRTYKPYHLYKRIDNEISARLNA